MIVQAHSVESHKLFPPSQNATEESMSTHSLLPPVVGPKRTESLQTISGSLIPLSLQIGGANLNLPLPKIVSPNQANVASSEAQSSVASFPSSPPPSASAFGIPSITGGSSSPTTAHSPGYSPKEQPQSLSYTLGTPSNNLNISRESRISLPEEAKRYMATLGDSPVPSPQVKVFASDSAAAKSQSSVPDVDANGDTNGLDTYQLAYNSAGGLDPGGEFPDSDGELSEDDEQESLGGDRSASSTFERETEGNKQIIGGTALLGRKPSADDFPMPPVGQPSHRDFHGDVTPSPGVQSHHQYANSYKYLDDVAQAPLFRALPLLSSDLPQTKVQVSHSSIRPNDKGKEVLSFVIIVDPGIGKDSWKIEKLYSDVIALDQRVKSMSRSLAKKMPVLPESKLWRDHAPAKVDQRKVMHSQLFGWLYLHHM
jgi:RalA-binding protein 1